jgi:UDP-glucose 4-epimerase
MRIAVIGASGNLGMAAVRALGRDDAVTEIVGIARRRPDIVPPKVRWHQADVIYDSLVDALRGADAAVHLAWAIQPSRDLELLRRTNVDGSRRVFDAVARAEVPALVYASSVGAYAPGPKSLRVDESWPVTGIDTSTYSRHKAAVEDLLDDFEQHHPGTRVVRLRPGLVFGRTAGSEIRRYFAGPYLPTTRLRRAAIPLVPEVRGLRVQAVHRDDVGEAIRLAVLGSARGPFNLVADPILDAHVLADLFGARRIKVPASVLHALATISWKLRLQPTSPDWLDLALCAPLLSSARARDELGWEPRIRADQALIDLLNGMRAGAGDRTPPLKPAQGLRDRSDEMVAELTGGRR